MKWSATQISPKDAELLNTRKSGVEEIWQLFQQPPPLVQDYSLTTFTNSETAGQWFAQFTLAPSRSTRKMTLDPFPLFVRKRASAQGQAPSPALKPEPSAKWNPSIADSA